MKVVRQTGLSSPSNVSSCVKSSKQSCRVTDDMLRPYTWFTHVIL